MINLIRTALIIIALGLMVSVVSSPLTSVAEAKQGDEDNVTLCHATASESNPFVIITTDSAGAFNGHLGGDHQDGEDIIPPFEWEGVTYSQNWDEEGQAIFNNGCEPVEEEPPGEEEPPTEPPVVPPVTPPTVVPTVVTMPTLPTASVRVPPRLKVVPRPKRKRPKIRVVRRKCVVLTLRGTRVIKVRRLRCVRRPPRFTG